MPATTTLAATGFAAVFRAAPPRQPSLVARLLRWARDRQQESHLALVDPRLLEDAGIAPRPRHPDGRG